MSTHVLVVHYRPMCWSFRLVPLVVLAGASEDVLTGLGALYAEMVQPSRPLRANFLAKLLQPFDSACNLNSHGASATDIRCDSLPAADVIGEGCT